jgi:HEAT repeat protein
MSPPETDAVLLADQLKNLRSPDRRVRREALEAVERCGPQDAELAPALSQMVLHRVLGVERIARGLGRIGPGAAVAVPALLGLLEEPVPGRRQAASAALADIGEPAAQRAVPALSKVLAREKDTSVREQVVADLGRFAEHSDEARAALAKLAG